MQKGVEDKGFEAKGIKMQYDGIVFHHDMGQFLKGSNLGNLAKQKELPQGC